MYRMALPEYPELFRKIGLPTLGTTLVFSCVQVQNITISIYVALTIANSEASDQKLLYT